MSARREELAANLATVRERIDAACGAAGRAPDDVTLVVVTKTHPATDVALLAGLGVTDVGENRHPEAGEKVADTADLLLGDGTPAPRWHFLGQVQTNKAGAVTRYADVVHSLDRAKLARSLSRGAEAAGREVEVLLQVDLDGSDPGRAGAAPADVPALAELAASLPGLVLGGVMTVAPLGVDPRPVFDELVRISADLVRDHRGATAISAGMSQDFEHAIAAGATHLRVGRSILGERPPLR